MTATIDRVDYDLNKKFQEDEEYEKAMEELDGHCYDFLCVMAKLYDLTIYEVLERMKEL